MIIPSPSFGVSNWLKNLIAPAKKNSAPTRPPGSSKFVQDLQRRLNTQRPIPQAAPATPVRATPNWFAPRPAAGTTAPRFDSSNYFMLPPAASRPGAVYRPAQTYPVAPAPIPVQQQMAWDEALLDATESLALARARQEAGRQEADANRAMSIAEVVRRFGTANTNARAQAGSAGMALSPAYMGRIAADLRDRQAQAQAGIEQERTMNLRGLLETLNAAERNMNRTKSTVAKQRAYYGADRNQLLPGVGY
jgi:hypothetical protein